MKFNLKWFSMLALALFIVGCAGKKELRRLESSYKTQLEEYAEQYKAGKITKAEHDKKVTLLNSRYGNRRAQMERDIYGDGIDRNRPAPMIGRGAAGRRY
tara:strand:+ start:671 stop:970 length:300 start_codon:yes stop_codon:yes gene_type:complete